MSISAFLLQYLPKCPLPTGLRLELHRTLLDSSYVKDISEAKKQDDYQKIQTLKEERDFEICLIDEEIDEYRTRKLLKKARRLMLSIPQAPRNGESKDENGHWYEGQYTGGRYLTNEGMRALRRAIHQERKEQFDLWFSLLAALTGFLGTLIGLVVVVLK